MNVRYATDQNWRHGIARYWDRIRPFEQRFGLGDRGPVIEPEPAPPEPTPEPAPAPAPDLTPEEIQQLLASLKRLQQWLEGQLK